MIIAGDNNFSDIDTPQEWLRDMFGAIEAERILNNDSPLLDLFSNDTGLMAEYTFRDVEISGTQSHQIKFNFVETDSNLPVEQRGIVSITITTERQEFGAIVTNSAMVTFIRDISISDYAAADSQDAFDQLLMPATGPGFFFDDRGSSCDDVTTGFATNDFFTLGAGFDTVEFSGPRVDYTVAINPTGVTVTDRKPGRDGSDNTSGVEKLRFDVVGTSPDDYDVLAFGQTVDLEEDEFESFVELYIAYFNRAPDALGLGFWGSAYANGTTLEEMAALFIDQDETRATYPGDQTNSDFATSVYGNVLGRIPDQAGFDFWVGQLDSGSVSRDAFILEVLKGAKAAPPDGASQEFMDQQAADQAYLSTKTDIGAYFAVHKGMSNVENARATMELFDGSANSLQAAEDAIDGYYASASAADGGEFLMPVVGVLALPEWAID
ncbi:MAG: DUF4214 domain-containing protein [Rhodobacteraceae bacterium]|nr:DUF4214 domain-containing protein [Paracoccaceae bacterium]